jgi:hypothetical protein
MSLVVRAGADRGWQTPPGRGTADLIASATTHGVPAEFAKTTGFRELGQAWRSDGQADAWLGVPALRMSAGAPTEAV